jgi:CheY-like chemotaxis protein/HPt (histidine-containing phosphotransfer) domain-containing protein
LTNADILRRHAEDWGMLASSAGSGREALALLKACHEAGQCFDAALLDVSMPVMDGVELLQRIRKDSSHAELPVIMLTSTDFRGDLAELRAAGCAAHLYKPLRKKLLYDTLRVACRPSERPLRPSAALPKPFRGTRVLLAEDNEVNQEVALAILDSLGCQVRLAANGQDAIDLSACDAFDLILMDCQMPLKDGYEAAREIRQRESTIGVLRIPIVALTANAMTGDRQKCLAAGMDDYLSKPFKKADLHSAMSRWLGQQAGGSPSSPGLAARAGVTVSCEQGLPTFDPNALEMLKSLQQDGWAELVGRILRMFFQKAPVLLNDLRAAYAAEDTARVRYAAHSLKSVAANVGGVLLSDLSRRLEAAARQGELDWKSEHIDEVEAEYRRVGDALQAYREIVRHE